VDAQQMIARAIERYGDRARWERLRLTLAPTSLRGLIPWMKGAGRTFRLPDRRFAGCASGGAGRRWTGCISSGTR